MLSFEDYMTWQLGIPHNPGGWTAVVNQYEVNKLFWGAKYQQYKDGCITQVVEEKKPTFRIINKKASDANV